MPNNKILNHQEIFFLLYLNNKQLQESELNIKDLEHIFFDLE